MKLTCEDIEYVIMRDFDFKRNLIVTRVTELSGLVHFEADVLMLSNSSYATGFEIKVSKSDLNAENKKSHINRINDEQMADYWFNRLYKPYKYFYYVVPEEMGEYALEVVNPRFGVITVSKKGEFNSPKVYSKVIRKSTALFQTKWNDKQRYQLARLGSMRIFSIRKNQFFNKQL